MISNFKNNILSKNIFNSVDKNYHPYFNMLLKRGIENYYWAPHLMHKFWPFWHLNDTSKNNNLIYNNHIMSLSNTTFRNWTRLSTLGINNSFIIDPIGFFSVEGFPFTLEYWIHQDDTLYVPNNATPIIQTLDTKNHSMTSLFKVPKANLTSTFHMSQSPDKTDCVFGKFTVTNTTSATTSLSLFLVIRPYDVEGVTNISTIQFLQNNLFIVNNKPSILFDKKPHNIVCLSAENGDIKDLYQKVDMIFNASCSLKKASAFAMFNITLKEHESHHISIKSPCNINKLLFFKQTKIQHLTRTLSQLSYNTSIDYNKRKHSNLLFSESTLNLPRPYTDFINVQYSYLIANTTNINNECLLQNTYKNSIVDTLVYLKLLTKKNISISKNVFKFNTQYLNSILSIIKTTPSSIADVGYWLEHLYHLMKLNVFVLNENHLKILNKISHFLLKRLKKLPSTNHIVFIHPSKHVSHRQKHLLINLLSILLFVQILQRVIPLIKQKKRNEIWEKSLSKYENQIKKAIDEFCTNVSNKIALQDIIPVSLTEYNSLMLIDTCHLYLKLFPSATARITNTINIIEKQFLMNNFIFSNINPSGYPLDKNIYFATMLRLIHSSKKISFNQLLDFGLSTYAFPDVCHPRTKGGSAGDGHSIRSGMLMLTYLIESFIVENDDSIELFKYIENIDYLKEPLSFIKLNTCCGQLSFKLSQQENTTTLEFSTNKNTKTNSLHIHTYDLFTSFEINNQSVKINTPVVTIPLITQTIIFHHKHEQTA